MADDAASGNADPPSPHDLSPDPNEHSSDEASTAPFEGAEAPPEEPREEPPEDAPDVADAPNAAPPPRYARFERLRLRPPTPPTDASAPTPRSRKGLWLLLGSLGLCVTIGLDVFFMRRAASTDSAQPQSPPSLAKPALNTAPSVAAPPVAAPAVSAPPAAGIAAREDADDALPAFDEDGAEPEHGPKKQKEPPHFGTVQEAAARSCSTASVDGLSRQIIEQSRCLNPKAFVPLPTRPNLVIGSHVFPYLEASARDRLLKVLDTHKDGVMTINSALRTVAQQYLVWRWSASKRCGVQLATPPGESNHETGLALDIAEQAHWRPALEAHDFHWLGQSDRVHFDYKGSTATPPKATDVLAFQQLWNKNHPNDTIAESGHYNPETEQRLKKSPADGFAVGLACKARGGRVTPVNKNKRSQ